MYGNVLDFGMTISGEDYLNIGHQPFDYLSILAAQEDREGDKDKGGRKVGIAVGAALAVGVPVLLAVTLDFLSEINDLDSSSGMRGTG